MDDYTRLVLELAEVDLVVAKAVAHSLPDRLAALPAPARARYLRVVQAVAKDRVSALPLVIRTLPNDEGRGTKDWSGSNPCYLQSTACAWLRSIGVKHLLLDLPSVDREEDGGVLAAAGDLRQH